MRLLLKKSSVLVGIVMFAIVMSTYLLLIANASAAGFRQAEPWDFDSPYDKSMKIQRETLRLLHKGNYFEGSHANKSIYIGDVRVDEISGNTTLVDQTSTIIGNYSNVEQSGDGTLNVSADAVTKGGQGSSNAATGLLNGAINSGERTVISNGGVE